MSDDFTEVLDTDPPDEALPDGPDRTVLKYPLPAPGERVGGSYVRVDDELIPTTDPEYLAMRLAHPIQPSNED